MSPSHSSVRGYFFGSFLFTLKGQFLRCSATAVEAPSNAHRRTGSKAELKNHLCMDKETFVKNQYHQKNTFQRRDANLSSSNPKEAARIPFRGVFEKPTKKSLASHRLENYYFTVCTYVIGDPPPDLAAALLPYPLPLRADAAAPVQHGAGEIP